VTTLKRVARVPDRQHSSLVEAIEPTHLPAIDPGVARPLKRLDHRLATLQQPAGGDEETRLRLRVDQSRDLLDVAVILGVLVQKAEHLFRRAL
jgi:hypothetical protein